VIEDAETLGALLSRAESRSQVSQLMTAYEDIRHPRCVQTYKHHRYIEAIMKYPIGPQQESRDHVLRQTLSKSCEDWDALGESGFQDMFGDHLTSFAYDATEAVEDHLKSMPFRRSPPLQIWIQQE
jgi:salicylate hydroxylase